MNLEALKIPFKREEIEFRLAQCGGVNGKIWAMCLAYISARAIQDRLDDVCGLENWKVSYEFVGDRGVICNLSVKCGAEWVTKQDGAEMTDIESFKGGISSALKRAGSSWGLGRYLYSLESGFAKIVDKHTQGAQYGKTKEGVIFYWLPPDLPDWALPDKKKIADEEVRLGLCRQLSQLVQHKQIPRENYIQFLKDQGSSRVDQLKIEDVKKGLNWAMGFNKGT